MTPKTLGRFLLIGAVLAAATATAQDDPIWDEFQRIRGTYDEVYNQERMDQAEQIARQMIAYGERHRERTRFYLQVGWQSLGDVLRRQGELAEAKRLLDQALELAEKEYGQDHDYSQILYLIALWHDSAGDDASALVAVDDAIRVLLRQEEKHHTSLWFYYKLRGQLLHEMSRLEEAFATMERALAEADEAYGQDFDYAHLLYLTSKIQEEREETESACDYAEEAVLVLAEQPAERQGLLFEFTLHAGRLLNLQGYTDDAQVRLPEAIQLGRQVYGADSPELFPAYRELLDVYWTIDDRPRVGQLLDQFEAYTQRVFPAGSLQRLTIDVHRGSLLTYEGEHDAAIDLLTQTRAALEAVDAMANFEYLLCLGELADALNSSRSPEVASPVYREAVEAAERGGLLSTFRGTILLREYGYNLYQQGRQHEAQAVLNRAADVVRDKFGEESWDYAWCLNYLAESHRVLGDFAAAEKMMRRAYDLMVEAVGEETQETARISRDLGNVYYSVQRNQDALAWFERSMRINADVLGEESVEWSTSAADVSVVWARLGRLEEAEKLFARVQRQWEKLEYLDAGVYAGEWADIYREAGRPQDALEFAQRELTEGRAYFGYDHVNHGYAFGNIARALSDMGRIEEALENYDRAIDTLDRFGGAPGDRAEGLAERAGLLLKLERPREAASDLRRAMDLAEQQRRLVGDERERARLFTEYASAFELMAACQFRLGDPVEGWLAMERSRARSLLDEMAMSGVNLDLGLDAAEREAVEQRRIDAETRVREAEAKLRAARAARVGNLEAMQRAVADAREQLYTETNRSLSGNEVYRNMISAGSSIPRLSQVQRELGGDVGLLSYLVGEEHSFVVAITGDDVHLHELSLDASEAAELDLEPGMLTRDRLDALLLGEDGSGVLPQLARRGDQNRLAARLAPLYRVLVPAEIRDVASSLKQLIVIPDGRLALVPFEALVVSRGVAPRYLLDAGPPISYAPSATVLFDLLRRGEIPNNRDGGGLLTVGDPAYGGGGKPGETRAAATLPDLPYSGLESQWARDAFEAAGLGSLHLTGSSATEEVVRRGVAGREVVHLACHGLADNQFGNFFGSLAVSLRPNAPSWDDGYLRMPEIYALDLKQCELAVLSACDTNLGEEQRGEGVWTLSRGFLVAGAKRVVASNWIVDDQAGARLTAEFLRQVAASMGEESTRVDYAASLQQAKRRLRSDRNYSHPYYWANFVLVGPN